MPIRKGVGPICALVNIKHSIQVELCDSDGPIYYLVDPHLKPRRSSSNIMILVLSHQARVGDEPISDMW